MVNKLQAEKELIQLVIQGDQAAFTSLYNNYVEAVFYFSLRYMKLRSDAENVTQEVFVKVWETRHRLDPQSSFSAYIFTIAKNIIFNLNRKKVNEQAYLDHLTRVISHADPGTEKEYFYRELKDQIDLCIEGLPDQRKKVFILSRREGLSHKEVSQKLGIAEKTVAAHIRLALQTIRKSLKESN